MQNLRQLKAEIRAALQLAIATENEKLEEALLNYRTNLTKLEQEYIGQSSMGAETVRAEEVAPLSASSEQEGFETAGSDIAEKRNVIISFAKALPNTDMRPWQEEIRNLDELPDVGKAANLLYRRADDDSGIELQKLSAPISRTANAEVKLNSETDVVELFESGGYVVEEVAHGKSRMKALQIKNENGKIVLTLYPYSDIRMKNGKYVFTDRVIQKKMIREMMNDTPNSRRLAQIEEFADAVLNNDNEISSEEIGIFLNNLTFFENDKEVQQLMTELLADENYRNAYVAYIKKQAEYIDYQQNFKGNITSGYYLIKNFFGGKADGGLSEQSLQNYEHNEQQENVNGVIYGQEVGPIANYKYGNSTMAKSGCAIIAAYNTMVLFGEQPDISEMILYFEQDGMVLEGYGGTNPYALENYLTAVGYNVENTTINLDDKLTDNNLVVLAFWNSDQSISAGVHTVVVQKDGAKIAVYNRSNLDTEAISYDSIHSYLTKGQNPPPKNARVLITAFVVEDKADSE